MKKQAVWLKDNKYLVLISFICIGYLCIPLMNTMIIQGDDLVYHLLRIENISEGLQNGQLPVRIGPVFMDGYGYASSLCYPEFFLYIPAFLRLTGMSMEICYKIFLVLTIIGAYISSFYCVNKIAHDKKKAVIGAMIYSLSQYHIANLYVRGAVGEIQAFVFIPLIIYGLYNLIFEDFERPWTLGVGFWGLMLSHTISLVLCLCMAFTLGLLYFKKIVFNKKKFLKLLVTAAIVLLTSSMYWLPFLEMLFSADMYFGQPWAVVSENAVSLSQIFSISYYDYTFNFDIIILLLCLLRLTVKREGDHAADIKKADWFLLMGAASLWVCTNLFPWKLLQPILNNIQFPWRFYGIASMFLATAISIFVVTRVGKKYIKESMVVVLALMIVSATVFYQNYPLDYYKIETGYFDKNSYNVVNGEWLPRTVDRELLEHGGTPAVLDTDGKSIEFQEQKRMGITFDSTGESEYFDIPRVFYKGYDAWIQTSDGAIQALKVDGNGENGLVRVYVPQGISGKICIAYNGTVIQTVAYVLNGISVILLLLYCYLKKRRIRR